MGTDRKRRGMDWARFDRGDQIATAILLWLLVGFSAGYAVFISLDWMLRRQVTLTEVPLEVGEDAAGTGRIVGMPTGTVLVEGVSAGHFALLMAPVLVGLIATVWGAVLLQRLLKDLGRGEPFSRANVSRLRIVALLLMVVPLASDSVSAIARSELLSAKGVDAYVFVFSPGWLLAGILVAAVAQAFASGVTLRSDVDGLV